MRVLTKYCSLLARYNTKWSVDVTALSALAFRVRSRAAARGTLARQAYR